VDDWIEEKWELAPNVREMIKKIVYVDYSLYAKFKEKLKMA
ncbi:MAG: hydroxymethylglutaryl-CoA synthase, partial [Methanobacteriaceae archaeon]|nr:hydroxymethylglutaryl-CoA synthase [Methanobacteriaceae archaeon]